MRLPVNGFRRALALGLTVALAACGRGGDVDFADNRPAAVSQVATAGASADYPVVLGDPYTVDGQTFTPADVMSVDEVGYAAIDNQGGQSVSIAHRTLPLPSYVELTSLETGKTILARAERRGPMTTSRLVAISPGAAEQLGARDGTAIRMRRVNPPEAERAALRSGRAATARLDTPMSLVEVLRERLPASGSVSLASAERPPLESGVATEPMALPQQAASAAPTRELPPVAEVLTPVPGPVAAPVRSSGSGELPPANAPRQVAAASAPVAPPAPVARAESSQQFDSAFSEGRSANRNYPLAPVTGVATSAPVPVVVSSAPETRGFSLQGRTTASAQPARQAATPPVQRRPEPAQAERPVSGQFVIQAAAFASQSNANRAANSLGGFVERSGRFYRVRTGPYTTRGQAEAALAKVRAAGYSDARVFTAG